MKALTSTPLLAILLLGTACDSAHPLDTFDATQQRQLNALCDCFFMDAGYASAAECKADVSDPPDDCTKSAYDQVPEIHAYLDCLHASAQTEAGCTEAAMCDETALDTCDTEAEARTAACTEPADAVFTRAGMLVSDCRAGPAGTCPEETSSTGSGAISTGTTAMRGSDQTGSCGGESTADVTVQWTAPSAGLWTFDTAGSSFDTVLYVLTACDGTELACNDDRDADEQSELTVELTEGQTIIIVIDGFSSEETGSYVLNATPPA